MAGLFFLEGGLTAGQAHSLLLIRLMKSFSALFLVALLIAGALYATFDSNIIVLTPALMCTNIAARQPLLEAPPVCLTLPILPPSTSL